MAELSDILASGDVGGPWKLFAPVAEFHFRDTDDPGGAYSQFNAEDHFDQNGGGIHNHTFGISFNHNDADPTLPYWGENWEPRFVQGGASPDLFEKNWTYKSPDRSVDFRPFTFSVEQTTHKADAKWHVRSYEIGPQDGASGDDLAAFFDSENHIAAFPGRVIIGAYDSGDEGFGSLFRVVGSPADNGGYVAKIASSGAFSAENKLLGLAGPTTTVEVVAIEATASTSNVLQSMMQNQGTGGVRQFFWAGSNGDAWMYFATAQNWSIGIDRSASNSFKISNSHALGNNDYLTIDTSGVLSFGTHSAVAAETITGYITIKDAAGNSRKLAVIS